MRRIRICDDSDWRQLVLKWLLCFQGQQYGGKSITSDDHFGGRGRQEAEVTPGSAEHGNAVTGTSRIPTFIAGPNPHVRDGMQGASEGIDASAQLGFLVNAVQSLADTVAEVDRKVHEIPQLVLEKLEASFVGVFAERKEEQKQAMAEEALQGRGLRNGATGGVPVQSSTSMRSAFSQLLRASKPEDGTGAGNSANGKDSSRCERADVGGIALTKALPCGPKWEALSTASLLPHQSQAACTSM